MTIMYMWSILLKEKGEAFEKFKNFRAITSLPLLSLSIRCFMVLANTFTDVITSYDSVLITT